MLFAIILSIALGVLCALITNIGFKKWIENKYNTEDARKIRYEEYVDDLQSFVDKNELSSDNTAGFLNWVSQNRNIYLFVYNMNYEPLFDSSVVEPEEEEDSSVKDENNSKEDEKTEEDIPPAEEDQEQQKPGDDSSKEDAKEENKKEPEKDNNSAGGGITIQYPSREEIIQSAKNDGLKPIKMADGSSLLVSIADFTEYIYYDAANVVAIVLGVLVLIVTLMLYFQNIIKKISVLAKDVTNVYKVNMNAPIRTRKGNNELAELTRNVEEMRSSMMQSLEKEKEAINANTELITSMSHDIRTPLTVLLGYLDIMKNSTDDKNMQEYIKASETTTMRLKNLSDDMFRYFLVFGGDIEVEMSEYSAKTLFDQLFTEHILLLNEKGYSFDVAGVQEINTGVYVRTDAPKMMRVVDNIFSNIHKYADRGELISIKSTIKDDLIWICVSNKIAKTKNENESNKVGLKTCKKLCEAMGACFEYTDVGETNDVFEVKLGIPVARSTEGVKNET